MNYKKLYFTLFNALTDAIDCLDRQDPAAAKAILIQAQQRTEEMYINEEE